MNKKAGDKILKILLLISFIFILSLPSTIAAGGSGQGDPEMCAQATSGSCTQTCEKDDPLYTDGELCYKEMNDDGECENPCHSGPGQGPGQGGQNTCVCSTNFIPYSGQGGCTIIQNNCEEGYFPDCNMEIHGGRTQCLGTCTCVSGQQPCKYWDIDNDNYYSHNTYHGAVPSYCGTDNDCDDDDTDDPSGCPSFSGECNFTTTECAICINPDAQEHCFDGVDNDCDGQIDLEDIGSCPMEYKFYPVGQGEQSQTFSFKDYEGIINLFNLDYSLLQIAYLYNYMRQGTHSDLLSDYAVYFKLKSSADFYSSYADSYSGNEEELIFNRTYDPTLVPPPDYPDGYKDTSVFLCDPDKDEIDCDSCHFGYELENEDEERVWDESSKECAGDDYYRLGIVKPDFLWAHVDDADFSETFCTQGPIGVNYSNPSLRDWDSDAFCCGDDDGTWYQDRNTQGGPEEPLSIDINNGLSNYHDCAKTVNVQEGTEEKQILCNYQKSSAGSIWYDSSEKIGEITALPCFKQVGGYQNENIELLSDGEEWFMCIEQDVPPPQTQTHQFRGQTFTEEKTVTDSTTGTDISHSYFCNPASDSENKSIYECQGSFTPPFSTESAGQTYSTGKNISYEQQVYYCAKETKDSPIEYSESSTLWTTDLDYTNAETCNIGVGTNRWTGKNLLHYYDTTTDFCCGEHEDIQELTNPGKEFSLYESYNDIGGLAACFNGTPQLNNNFIEDYEELYVIEGEIQGCAIDRNHAKGLIHPFPDQQYKDNDHLLELLDWPNPAQENQPREDALLINDRQYCEIINGTEEYFCSYKEVWNTTGGLNLNHLSIIPQEFWENDTYPQNAECCEPTQCWDSTQCIEQQLNPSSEPYFGNYRCINGTWAVSDLKYDWDNHMSGYCFSQTQCLVNPSGEYGNSDNPICIESDEFIGDHYCENGNWTTRTKYLALELLDLTKTTNQNLYTIYCDDYTNTLNNINYIQQPSGMNIIDFILVQRFTKGYTFNSVNNFCILNTENNIILATSLNHPIELEDYSNFINVFEHTGETSLPESDEGYQLIQNSNYIYYNNQTNSIIYSKQQLNFQEYDTNLLDFFQNLFQYITNFFTPGGFTSTYDFINQTKDFNQLYISNEKQVVAIREKVTPTQEHLSISYAGTGADICESVEKYDDYISTTDSIQCNETRGITYIASSLPEGINVWSQITKKLRPQQAS